jgi:hypothetical protein
MQAAVHIHNRSFGHRGKEKLGENSTCMYEHVFLLPVLSAHLAPLEIIPMPKQANWETGF